MMKRKYSALLLLLYSITGLANAQPSRNSYTSLSINPVSNRQVKLDTKELRAVWLSDEWKKHPDMPVRGQDGSVVFTFGATLPSVVCAPLYVSDIRLQPGETILQVDVGDAVRWKVSPASSGSGESSMTHLLVKPVDAGLITNLVINTNRRTYNLKLVSRKTDWMPQVSFEYPEDVQAQWKAYYEEHAQYLKGHVLATGQDLSTLDFNFKLSGDSPSWRPLRVYTDGVKTYVQFPSAMKNSDAPVLVALGLDKKEQLVNYRLVGDRYVVDKVLDSAALISGVGRHQDKVVIKRDRGS